MLVEGMKKACGTCRFFGVTRTRTVWDRKMEKYVPAHFALCDLLPHAEHRDTEPGCGKWRDFNSGDSALKVV